MLLLDLVGSRCLSHDHLKEILCHGNYCGYVHDIQDHEAWEPEQKNESLTMLAQWRKVDVQSSSRGQEDDHIIIRKGDPTEVTNGSYSNPRPARR
jgi:hypothetical protein